jgi:hypothetical protein
MSRAMIVDPQPEEDNVDSTKLTRFNKKQLSNLKKNQAYQKSTKASL